MSLAFQLANIFPFVHFFLSQYFISEKRKFLWDTVSAYVLVLTGAVICILIGEYWNYTLVVFGKTRSLPFLILVFFAGMVDCTSSVVFWPIVSRFLPSYSSALTIGEGATGLVVGVIGLLQESGVEERFSFRDFCWMLSAVMVLSAISLSLVRFLPIGKKELQPSIITAVDQQTLLGTSEVTEPPPIRKLPFIQKNLGTIRLTVCQCIISFVSNGILTALIPYVFLHYPDGDKYLRWAILIGLIVGPLFSFLAYWIPFHSILLHGLWLILAIFLSVIGFMSPHPPFASTIVAPTILVILKLVFNAILEFAKTKEFLIAHQSLAKIQALGPEQGENPPSFRIGGMGIQLGALVGAVIMIFVVPLLG